MDDDKQLTTTELISKITNPKYLKFLDLYPKCKCMISETAKAVGVERTTVHGWLKRDAIFQDAFNSLKKDIEVELEEYYVKTINSIVESDKTPPQTQLLGSFFMLKALNPRYKDRQGPDIQFTGDIIVQSSIPRPEIVEASYRELKEGSYGQEGSSENQETEPEKA